MLSEKIGRLEGRNICLQNIQRELLEQVGERQDYVETLEEEICELKEEYATALNDKKILKEKLSKLEV